MYEELEQRGATADMLNLWLQYLSTQLEAEMLYDWQISPEVKSE